MKIFQVITVITILCLQINISFQYKSTNDKSNEKSNTVMLAKLMNNAKCGNDDPSDCGCKIIKAYWEPPHKLKKRPYETRWPRPLKIKSKTIQDPIKVTCDRPEGALFYYKLKALFPKPKKHRHGKEGKGRKDGKINHQAVVTQVSSVVKAEGNLGPFGQKIIYAVQAFLRRYHLDIHPKKNSVSNNQVKQLKANAKAGAKIPGKADKKKKKPKRLTYEQKEKLKSLRMKKTLLRKQRSTDFHNLRRMLQDNYKYPYRGDKCVAIGEFIKRATSYAL